MIQNKLDTDVKCDKESNIVDQCTLLCSSVQITEWFLRILWTISYVLHCLLKIHSQNVPSVLLLFTVIARYIL